MCTPAQLQRNQVVTTTTTAAGAGDPKVKAVTYGCPLGTVAVALLPAPAWPVPGLPACCWLAKTTSCLPGNAFLQRACALSGSQVSWEIRAPCFIEPQNATTQAAKETVPCALSTATLRPDVEATLHVSLGSLG